MNEEQLTFDLYLSIIKRLRWILIALISVSGTLLFHAYLIEYSFDKSLLIKAIANRVESAPKENNEKLLTELKAITEKKSNEYQAKLHDYAEREFHMRLTDNTINDIKLKEHSVLPFLGITVFDNDFTAIMAFTLLILMIAAWGNFKAARSALGLLPFLKSNKLRDIAQIYFLFFNEPGSKDNLFSKFVMYGAIWLPFAALTVGIFFDIYPFVVHILTPNDPFVFGENGYLILKELFMVCMWCCVGMASLACTTITKQIYEQFFKTQAAP